MLFGVGLRNPAPFKKEKQMLYNLQSEIDIQHAKKRLDVLIKKGCIAELKEKKPRSGQSNRYLHLLLSWFGLELGYTLNEAKQIYKKVNGEIYAYFKMAENIDGCFYRSSADLDSVEMAKSIDIFRKYSEEEAGVRLPLPNEDKFLQEIQVQASRSQYL